MWSSVFGVLCSCLHAWEKFPLRGGALAGFVCVTERGIWWIMEQMWSVLGFSLSLSRPCAHPFIVSFPRCCISLSILPLLRPSVISPFLFAVASLFIWFPCLILHFLSCFPSFPFGPLRRLMLSLKRASYAWALVMWCKIESRRRKGCINFCKSFRHLSVPHKAVSLLLFILLLSVWFT